MARDDIDSALAAAEHAAFHDGPAEGLSLLVTRNDDLTGSDRHAEWLRGVCLGALGHYGDAFARLETLVTGGDRWASLASSTIASLHRQLGRHEAGREHDRTALAVAGGDVEALVEARLGLAADAVGLGQAAEAAGQLELARALLRQAPTGASGLLPGDGWRVRVRADWVAAEVALLSGQPGRALMPSATAAALAERNRAPRHLAKSLLFRCVARLLTGSPEEALADGERCLGLGVGLGALPLVWPVAGLLTGSLADRLGPDRRGAVLEQGAYAVRGIAASLPVELARAWTAGPDVQALLERARA